MIAPISHGNRQVYANQSYFASLPLEIIQIILSLGDPKDRRILLTCRRIYKIGFPLKAPVVNDQVLGLLRKTSTLLPFHKHFCQSVFELVKINKKNRNNIFIFLSACGTREMMRELIFKNPKIDPAAQDNYALCSAILNKNIETVKELLKLPQVDPSWEDNEPIILAASFNCLDAVREILKDRRVDPAAKENRPLFWAIKYNNIEMVKAFLDDDRIDPSAHDNYVLNSVCRSGDRAKILQLLLNDGRSNPSPRVSRAFQNALNNSHWGTVKILIKDPRVYKNLKLRELLELPFVPSRKSVIETVTFSFQLALLVSAYSSLIFIMYRLYTAKTKEDFWSFR